MLVEGKKENHDSYHTGQIQADNDPVEGIHKYSYAVLGDVYAEIASAPMSPRSLIFRVNSCCKCTMQFFIVDFMWCLVVKALSWSMIKLFHRQCNLCTNVIYYECLKSSWRA